MKKIIQILLLSLLLSACGAIKPWYSKHYEHWEEAKMPPEEELRHTVFLLGDPGAVEVGEPAPVLDMARLHMKKAGENSSIVFLGDNLYYHGLPPETDEDRPKLERRLNIILDAVKDMPAQPYFVPGNHDWNESDRQGLEYLIEQQVYVENYLNRGNTFLPDLGCPGPVPVELNDNTLLLVIDTEWWLHKYEKPYGGGSYCKVEDEFDFLLQLDELLEANQDKHVLLVAHHPLFSNGTHGGYFSLKDYVFPISLVRQEWYGYIPLPGIGSIYPLWRRFGGVNQDIPHEKYQQYINALLAILDKYSNVSYAAGHDHNLQHHIHKDNLHHITSGSASKKKYVEKRHGASFVHRELGFAKVKYYANGEAWVEYWEPSEESAAGKLVFKTNMYALAPEETPAEVQLNDYKDSVITIAANPDYLAGGVKELLLGDHYREVWATPVTMPYLDMERFAGGLTPTRMGGGKQTISLKLKGKNGKEYSLRSINKDPSAKLPVEWHNTFAGDLVQDQISAAHPYGFMAIPKLAEAVNVYHTNPKLVYVSRDPRLQQYIDEIGGQVAMIEEHPDDDQSDVESFGYSKNVVGTDKVLEKIYKDNDNEVDQKNYLRARLLDMLINDWDRHDDQWRWASFKKEKGTLYKPIPEDRDQVFFKFDGVIPWFASRSWALREVRNFGDEYKDIIGLNYTARTIDRIFLTKLTREEWLAIADSMRNELTDEVLESALREMPDTIYEMTGPEILEKLKSRRDQLTKAAEDYYEVLAKQVEIKGSDKHERFDVFRKNNDETQVTVYKTNREGEVQKVIYDRTFYRKETDEVRLYGLGGNDIFNIHGDVKKGIMVRVISGAGKDTVMDKSIVAGSRGKTKVYTSRLEAQTLYCIENCDVSQLHQVGIQTPKEIQLSYYNRKPFEYDYYRPLIDAEYHQSDGLFLGGGVKIYKHSFRKEPYASTHKIIGNVAIFSPPATAAQSSFPAFNLEYEGDFTTVVKKWDMGIFARYAGPQYMRNFFGWGNETPFRQNIFEDDNNSDLEPVDYYRVRYSNFIFEPNLNKALNEFLTLGFGPRYEFVNVVGNNSGTFLVDSFRMAAPALFTQNHYAGAKFFGILRAIDNELVPKRGIKWDAELQLNHQINQPQNEDAIDRFAHLNSDLSVYITPRFPFELTWSFRLGGATNIGDYKFYHANTLGGRRNLRGYHRTRFTGDHSLYFNFEPRLALFRFETYIFPARLGILGHYDVGRVWYGPEASVDWHIGYGGGLWMDVARMAIISGTYSIGEVSRLINLHVGFFF